MNERNDPVWLNLIACLGPHHCLEVVHIVDEYDAILWDADRNVVVAEGWGETPKEAIDALDKSLVCYHRVGRSVVLKDGAS